MSKTTRDAMTPGPGGAAEVGSREVIAADDHVDDALQAILERNVDRLSVIDGHRIIGSVSPGDLATRIEDRRTWSALCK